MCLNFESITQKDILKILPYFNLRKNKACESIFLDIFLWKDYSNLKYAFTNNAIFFRMYLENDFYASLPICKEENLCESFEVLKNYFNKKLNKKLKIYLADEKAVNILNLDSSIYSVYEVENAKDYLYSAEALKTLSGKKLRKKKNHINAFLKENNGKYEYKTLNCSNKEEIWNFLLKWREYKGENAEEHLDGELNGIKNILDNCSFFTEFNMAGVYINDNLEAFTLGSYNKLENMAVIHIEKANPNIRGLYPFINQQFIKNNFPQVEIVNREDDLGIDGLRKAKLSYDPIDFVKKYRIIEK